MDFTIEQTICSRNSHDILPGQQFVLHDRVVVVSPVHSVPPLAGCLEIVLEPLCVPPPHILEHVLQLHELHSQLTEAIIIWY